MRSSSSAFFTAATVGRMLLLGCIYHGRPSLAWAVGGCLGRRASSWVRSCVSLQRHPPVHHPGALWLAGWQAGRPCSSLRAKKEEEDSAAVPTKKKPAPAAATPKKKATTTKTSKKAVTPKQKPPPFEPNPLWLKQLEGIREMRRSADAPVDYFGCAELGKRHASSEKHMRFQTLISSMLSSQTTDIMNEKAMGRLYEACGITIEGLEALGEEGIVEAIKPVSFYTAKAANILKVCAILREKYDGDIPRTFDELMALPGCGPKMSVLVCAYAWNEVVGICVDTHVHRISNRLGWANTWNHKNPKAQNPEKTRKLLESWMPKEHWEEVNPLLVGLGQQTCRAIGPLCGRCKITAICPSYLPPA